MTIRYVDIDDGEETVPLAYLRKDGSGNTTAAAATAATPAGEDLDSPDDDELSSLLSEFDLGKHYDKLRKAVKGAQVQDMKAASFDEKKLGSLLGIPTLKARKVLARMEELCDKQERQQEGGPAASSGGKLAAGQCVEVNVGEEDEQEWLPGMVTHLESDGSVGVRMLCGYDAAEAEFSVDAEFVRQIPSRDSAGEPVNLSDVKKGMKVLAYYSLDENADRGFYEASVVSSKTSGEVTVRFTAIDVDKDETVPVAYVHTLTKGEGTKESPAGKSEYAKPSRLGNCEGKHGLEEFTTPEDDWYCSECHLKDPDCTRFRTGHKMFGCTKGCDYDLCEDCYKNPPQKPRPSLTLLSGSRDFGNRSQSFASHASIDLSSSAIELASGPIKAGDHVEVNVGDEGEEAEEWLPAVIEKANGAEGFAVKMLVGYTDDEAK